MGPLGSPFALLVGVLPTILFSQVASAQEATDESTATAQPEAEAPPADTPQSEASGAVTEARAADPLEPPPEAEAEAIAEAEAEASTADDTTSQQTAGMWDPVTPEAKEESESGIVTQSQDPPPGPKLLTKDRLPAAGYVPGYRAHEALSASRYSPRIGAFPGGVTTSFGAPFLGDEWQFKFAGFMTMSAQYSLDYRRFPTDEQQSVVFHSPPQTVDTYSYFTSTSTVPGNWVGTRWSVGNSRITANLSLDTWNPTRPTTYYQLGSQYFINNAYLDYTPAKFGDLSLGFRFGRFNLSYGGLGRYGAGVYVNPVSGGPQGIGGLTTADFDLNDKITLHGELGFASSRDGVISSEVVPSPQMGWRRPLWLPTWMPHAHIGMTVVGDITFKAQAHYISEFSLEDRNDYDIDYPQTLQADESNVPDGSIHTWGLDARLSHESLGWLAAGISYTKAENSFPFRGLSTYGGIGEQLTDNYLGASSLGTGELFVFAINYNFSIGSMVNYPRSFGGDGPDIVVNAGFHLIRVGSPLPEFDGKLRNKFGLDTVYTFLPNWGLGLRIDRVAPNSKDDEETFYVLAPRLVFKTHWVTHEQVQLMYGKWFYGEHTRNEGTGLRTQARLDDEMIALNFNMWW